MYDLILRDDLKNFKRGADNIYELKCRYRDIIKIIKNRTKDKLDFLKMMVEYDVINADLYNELLLRAKSDYKLSFIYLIGRAQL